MKNSSVNLLKIIIVIFVLMTLLFSTSCSVAVDTTPEVDDTLDVVKEINNKLSIITAIYGIVSFLVSVVFLISGKVNFRRIVWIKAKCYKLIFGLNVLVPWGKKNRVIRCKIPQLAEPALIEKEATFPEAEFKGYITLGNTMAEAADIVLIADESKRGKDAKSDCSDPVLLHLGGPVHEHEVKYILEQSLNNAKFMIFVSETKFKEFQSLCDNSPDKMPYGIIHNINELELCDLKGIEGGLQINNDYYPSNEQSDYFIIGRISRKTSFGQACPDVSDFFVFGHTKDSTSKGIDYLARQYKELKNIIKSHHYTRTDSFLFVFELKNHHGVLQIDPYKEPHDYSTLIESTK